MKSGVYGNAGRSRRLRAVRVYRAGRFEFDDFNHLTLHASLPPTVGRVVVPGSASAGRHSKHFKPTGNIGRFTFIGSGLENGSIRTTSAHLRSSTIPPPDRRQTPAPATRTGTASPILRTPSRGFSHSYDIVTTPIIGDVDVKTRSATSRPGPAPGAVFDSDTGEGPPPRTEQLDDVNRPRHPYRLYDSAHASAHAHDRLPILADSRASPTPAARHKLHTKSGLPTSPSRRRAPQYYPVAITSSSRTRRRARRQNRDQRHAVMEHAPSTRHARHRHRRELPRTTGHEGATEARFPGRRPRTRRRLRPVHANAISSSPVTRLEELAPSEGGPGRDRRPTAERDPANRDCPAASSRVTLQAYAPAATAATGFVLSKVATTLAGSGQKLCVQLRSPARRGRSGRPARDRGAGPIIRESTFTARLEEPPDDDTGDRIAGVAVRPTARRSIAVSDEHGR